MIGATIRYLHGVGVVPPRSDRPRLASSIWERSRGRWHCSAQIFLVVGMVEERVARLRQQAEHCRRLALSLCDEPTIIALLEMAQEYEEKADRFEGKEWLGR